MAEALAGSVEIVLCNIRPFIFPPSIAPFLVCRDVAALTFVQSFALSFALERIVEIGGKKW